MLTVLFVCHISREPSASLVPALNASDRLLVGHCGGVAGLLLSAIPFDAIIIHQDHLRYGCDVVAQIKRLAPRTPVMLVRDRNQPKQAKPPGIAAVCSVDLGDEGLVKSIWGFLRLILGKQAERRWHTIPCANEKRVNHYALWLSAE